MFGEYQGSDWNGLHDTLRYGRGNNTCDRKASGTKEGIVLTGSPLAPTLISARAYADPATC